MVITTGNFLLDCEPAERVYFFGPWGKESRRELKLINKNRYKVAFKVKCSANNVVRIDPPAGLIPIGETFTVTLAAGPSKPQQFQNLFIMNIPAPDGVVDARDAWAKHEGPDGCLLLANVSFALLRE
ncbi:MAG: motile sperm domain-containing protein [Gammaproteobacteria bacterium]|nr:motile sperm domain-containing protein [Gammaproteobacteria bacterium]